MNSLTYSIELFDFVHIKLRILTLEQVKNTFPNFSKGLKLHLENKQSYHYGENHTEYDFLIRVAYGYNI